MTDQPPSQTLSERDSVIERANQFIVDCEMGPDCTLCETLRDLVALATPEASPQPPPLSEGVPLPVVDGHVMLESLEGFERRCLIQIAHLQADPYPNMDAIEIIAQAVRCVREYRTSRELSAHKAALAAQEAVPQPLGSTPRTWQNAALRVGEELASVGPPGYYAMTPDEWVEWALATLAARHQEGA